MPQPPNEGPSHRRPHSSSMAEPYLEFDLGRELEQLHREPEWERGQNARTLVKYDTMRVVLTALKAGARIPEHRTDGRITVHSVRGRIVVHAEGRTFDLPVGAVLALDQGVRHDVEAVEDSAFLLTIAWPGKRGDTAS